MTAAALRLRGAAAALLVGSALSACSGAPAAGGAAAPSAAGPSSAGPATSAASSPSPEPGSGSEPPQARAPLTGLPVDATAARSGVVAVPVVVSRDSTAPTGLAEADLAYVAFPRPQVQRVLALYQSRVPERVGPVAQTRPMDGKLVGLFDATLQYGGGPASFVRQLDRAEVEQWSSLTTSSGFERAPSGVLYAAPSAVAGRSRVAAPPFGVLPFSTTGPADEDPGDRSEVQVTIPSQDPLTLRYDTSARRWTGALGRLPVSATNVVLQEVDDETLVLPKTDGATERDPVLVSADGRATVLGPSGPVSATWNRRGRATLTSYVADGGVPVRLTPGTTWVLLVPEGTEVEGVARR